MKGNQIKEALDYLDNIAEIYVDKKRLVGDESFIDGRTKDAVNLFRFFPTSGERKMKALGVLPDISDIMEKSGQTMKKISKGDLKILREVCKKFRETYASLEEMRKYCGKEAEELKKRGKSKSNEVDK